MSNTARDEERPPSVFFALMLRNEAAEQVEQQLQAAGVPKALGRTVVRRDNRHQSLSDLQKAPVDLALLQSVGAAVRGTPFVLKLDGVETPRSHGKKIYWTLRVQQSEALEHLLDAIRRALQDHKLPRGIHNRQHVTLSYWAPSALTEPILFDQPVEWPVKDFQLVRSIGQGAAYTYEELGSWKLDGLVGTAPHSSQLSLL